MQIEAFNFTGNETNRTVTLNEISDAVHLAIVDDDTGKYPHFRITGMSNSQRIGHTAGSTTAITALGSGSISIGTSTDVNEIDNAITGFAVRDDGNDDFKVGSYVGDGGATKSIATGLSDLENVWVFEDASTAAYWHSKSMGATTDASYPFVNGVSASGYITDIGTTAGTFIVGSALNTSGKTYFYVAWGSVSGFIDSISFSGNSTDNRNLDVDPNNGGNTPEFGHIGNDTTARNGNWRVEENSRGHSGDSCSQWTAATTQTNRLQGFSSETIQLGYNTDVNATGNSYDIFWAINNPAAAGATYYQTNTGSITPSGLITKKVFKTFTGSATPSGALTTRSVFTQAVAGSITMSGSLVKKTMKSLTGIITATGALTKKTAKALSGNITPVGTLVKKTARTLQGSFAPSGVLGTVYTTTQTLVGSITPSGVVTTVKTIAVVGVAFLRPIYYKIIRKIYRKSINDSKH